MVGSIIDRFCFCSRFTLPQCHPFSGGVDLALPTKRHGRSISRQLLHFPFIATPMCHPFSGDVRLRLGENNYEDRNC
jgi:hypothetical protein